VRAGQKFAEVELWQQLAVNCAVVGLVAGRQPLEAGVRRRGLDSGALTSTFNWRQLHDRQPEKRRDKPTKVCLYRITIGGASQQ
jgi:hypothetical protein